MPVPFAPMFGVSMWRWSLRLLLGAIGLALLFLAVVLIDGWQAFGQGPSEARRQRMEASSQWAGGIFENPEPMFIDNWGAAVGFLDKSAYASPTGQLPVERVTRARFTSPPKSGVRVTWLGHSTLVIEVDGWTFLTDPVWGERTSPVSFSGPERWYAPPLRLRDLPQVDAVLISHDHYDHLDYPTIKALTGVDTVFIAPLGVGQHLAYWGIAEERILELDWWDRRSFGKLELVMTPSRHASGRHVFDQNRTLWAGYALLSPRHRIFFSGDTGLFPGLREIGERLGPFDLTMLEVGAYAGAWPDWHLGPEQAVRAHQMLRGEVMLPIHWGLFDLALHGWTAPVERTLLAAEKAGVTLVTPKPGASVELDGRLAPTRWWPKVPFKSAEQDPVVATRVD